GVADQIEALGVERCASRGGAIRCAPGVVAGDQRVAERGAGAAAGGVEQSAALGCAVVGHGDVVQSRRFRSSEAAAQIVGCVGAQGGVGQGGLAGIGESTAKCREVVGEGGATDLQGAGVPQAAAGAAGGAFVIVDGGVGNVGESQVEHADSAAAGGAA